MAGVLVNQLGSLDRSGGGTAMAAVVQSWAEDQEASFCDLLALMALGTD